MKKSIWTIVLTVGLSVLASAGVALLVNNLSNRSNTVNTASGQDSVVPDAASGGVEYRTVNLSASEYPDFTYAAENAVDAVVYVKVTVQSQTQMMYNDPFLDLFFGGQSIPQIMEAQASGSGVIISQDGYIVTNNHVIDGATKIEVVLNDNTTHEATLVGRDPATDIALLKIEAGGLKPIPFGDSDDLRLGEWVLAIGSPFDLRSTITAGIVSAKGRSMPNYTGQFKVESFIQTDAAVNPGNSGGALVNKTGELVGINTAIISQTGQYAGYSFAVPVNIVKKITGDLLQYGKVRRAVLGVLMMTVDEKVAEEMKLSSSTGVYISEVSKGSAAEKAGIKAGDILIKVDGRDIRDASALQVVINSYHPGDKAEITVLRDGRQLTLPVEFLESATNNI
ncbi:MAG: trypsin-like peptidase domain-containing protein [Bacteroidales bacterium]|nr:trypsin-like peptidase domain-containing protein [Bacteroidales bacterium]